MKLSLIVAMATNRAIGLDGQMPWHLSADLKYFKKVTMGKPIVMGRKTFEAIGRPLAGRENIIISRHSNYQAEGCQVYNSIEEVLESYQQADELMIIGGATLYRALLPLAQRLYLTKIHQDFSADTFFPEIDESQWKLVSEKVINEDEQVDFSYSFQVLERLN